MLDLLHHAINLLRDSVWGGIAVAVAILIPALGVLARAIYINRTSDLTRDELKLLKVFSDQAKGNPRAYLSVEITAYKAEVDEYEVKLRRLKDLGYLRDSSSRQATSAIALSGSPPAAFAEQKGNDKSFSQSTLHGKHDRTSYKLSSSLDCAQEASEHLQTSRSPITTSKISPGLWSNSWSKAKFVVRLRCAS